MLMHGPLLDPTSRHMHPAPTLGEDAETHKEKLKWPHRMFGTNTEGEEISFGSPSSVFYPQWRLLECFRFVCSLLSLQP